MIRIHELPRNTCNLEPVTGIPEGKERAICVQVHQVAVFGDR